MTALPGHSSRIFSGRLFSHQKMSVNFSVSAGNSLFRSVEKCFFANFEEVKRQKASVSAAMQSISRKRGVLLLSVVALHGIMRYLLMSLIEDKMFLHMRMK